MENLGTLSERLVFALEKSKMRKIDLAKAVDVSPQVIHRLCNSKTHSTRFAADLASALGVNLEWLTSGEGPAFIIDSPRQWFLNEHTAVPIIEKSEINEYIRLTRLTKNNLPRQYCYIKRKTNTAFAIIMPDTSMEPLIRKKSTVVFDSQLKDSFLNGDIVLIYLTKFDEHLIRSIAQPDKEQRFFIPYNSDIYKSISGKEAHIVGKIIAYSWESQCDGDNL